MTKGSAASEKIAAGKRSAPLIQAVAIGIICGAVGAVTGYVLAESLPEGAVVGALLGGSLGLIIAMRRANGAGGPAFEYEAAGIHDDNLITTARRNLIREAYRDSYAAQVFHEKIERRARRED